MLLNIFTWIWNLLLKVWGWIVAAWDFILNCFRWLITPVVPGSLFYNIYFILIGLLILVSFYIVYKVRKINVYSRKRYR